MAKFIIGRTYSTRSACDHNCIFSITIASRTAKMITTTTGKRLKVKEWDGNEQVKPMGSYSMCPIIGADDKDLSAVVHPAYIEASAWDYRLSLAESDAITNAAWAMNLRIECLRHVHTAQIIPFPRKRA